MANAGKFVDRFPDMRTAGVSVSTSPHGVAECLTFPVTMVDIADAVSRSLNKKSAPSQIKPTKANDVIYRNYNTNVKEILEADMRTGFEAFRAELRETAYKSYWRDEVGKIPDQVPNLPVGMDPENTVFGSPPVRTTTAADLITPKKCRALVKFENSLGHELYCKSHSSYEAGEQKRVMDPPLPPNVIFGKPNVTDNSGKHVKMLMQWIDQSVVSMTSKSLAEYKDLLYYPLGRGRVRSGVPEGVTKDTVFGKPGHHGEETVMKNRDKILPLLVAYLFKLKEHTKKMNVDLTAFRTSLNAANAQKSDRLPVNVVYRAANQLGLKLDENVMNQILFRLNLLNLQDGTVLYRDMIKLLNAKEPLPDFGRSEHSESENYFTNYMDQCADLQKKSEYVDLAMAGSPSFITDKPSIRLPFGSGWCLANVEDIPMQTSVDDVIRPHIFTHYGLSIYDVFKPRSKEYIKELFIEKVGLKIPDNVFEIMWKEGLERDGVVSVETFKNILTEISTGKLEQLADTTIHNAE